MGICVLSTLEYTMNNFAGDTRRGKKRKQSNAMGDVVQESWEKLCSFCDSCWLVWLWIHAEGSKGTVTGLALPGLLLCFFCPSSSVDTAFWANTLFVCVFDKDIAFCSLKKHPYSCLQLCQQSVCRWCPRAQTHRRKLARGAPTCFTTWRTKEFEAPPCPVDVRSPCHPQTGSTGTFGW